MVNRWAIAARPMPGIVARPSDAPTSPDSNVVGGRTEFGLRSCAATELQTGTTWPEVDRSADVGTPIDRESGTAGTDIKATAESRLTADPNSARTDLESAAIFAGADSDYGGLIGSTSLRGLS